MISNITVSPKLDFPCFIAEFLGVFFLVLFTCYSNIQDVNSPSESGVCIFLLYTFFTYALAPISGAHLNPAITLCLIVEGKLAALKGFIYIGCHLIGSMVAALLVLALRPKPAMDAENVFWLGQPTVSDFAGTNEPVIGIWALGLSELVASAILMFVWKCAMLNVKTPNGTYGFIIGSLYGVVGVCLGRVNGGSMNPARSFGPALLSDFSHILFYIFAPLCGTIIGGAWYEFYNVDPSKKAQDTDNTGLQVLKPVDISLDESELSKLE